MLVLNFNQASYIWQVLFLISLLEKADNEEIKAMHGEFEEKDLTLTSRNSETIEGDKQVDRPLQLSD